MKIKVKTLKGSVFEIDANSEDSIIDVKKNIETTQGGNVYPYDQQMLIHQGKVLKDETTLQENQVVENSFVVIMLKKTKGSSSGTSAAKPAAPKVEGIPEQAEVPPVARAPPSGQTAQAPQPAPPAAPSGGPNANPLDLFPQGLPNLGSNAGAGTLDFLRTSPQFRALQAMVQANPQILQPMLQELGKQNPQVMRLIQEHQSEFLSLINEPAEGGESNLLGQLAGAVPQALTVTPEEREAIERLEAMGFERGLVLEVFFACNKNEEQAANYLLDHMHEFED